jgi:hypothetical protein
MGAAFIIAQTSPLACPLLMMDYGSQKAISELDSFNITRLLLGSRRV